MDNNQGQLYQPIQNNQISNAPTTGSYIENKGIQQINNSVRPISNSTIPHNMH